MLLRSVTVLALFCAALPAQEDTPKRSKETLGLIDQARALPPEFCADSLLRLSASRLVPDAKWKRELIEEAFTTGAQAQLPYERIAYGTAVDACPNQEFHRNGMEALTLRLRSVQAMLAIDGRRAGEMFQEIVLPELPKEKCDESAVANVDVYYQLAGQVFDKGFTDKQRKKEEDLQFLNGVVARITSPAQVPAVFRMISSAKIGQERGKRLLTAYSVALDRVRGGDRTYGSFESTTVPFLISQLDETAMFLPALRAYVVRQVTGPRCSDHLQPGKPAVSVTAFNALAAKVNPSIPPITADEAKPGKDEGTFAAQLPFASSARSKQVLLALRWLDHGDGNLDRGFNAEERKSVEWNDHFNDLLKLIEGWKESDEDSPEEYLIFVAQTYVSLALSAPPGAAKENVMGRYLNFIETHYSPTGKRNLWFTQVAAMLKRGSKSEDPETKQWVLDHFARSSNPVIALYTKLEALSGN